MKEVQEDEVLFEKTDEDPVKVETTSTALSQTTSHNVTVLMKSFHRPTHITTS